MNDVDLKAVNKNISTAKRLWKQKQKVTTYNDEISKAENALFVDNVELSELVQKRIKLEEEIVDYVDSTLLEHRTKLGIGKKEATLKESTIYILTDVLKRLNLQNGLVVSEEDSERWVINNSDLIIKVESLLESLKHE